VYLGAPLCFFNKFFINYKKKKKKKKEEEEEEEKSKVSSNFQIFHHMIQTQFNASIRIVRFDNGREYLSSCLNAFFRERIIHQTTCVDTPHQNRVAEQKN